MSGRPGCLRRLAPALGLCVGLAGCGRAAAPKTAARASLADSGRCEYQGRSDREVEEAPSSGSLETSIRRVYQVSQPEGGAPQRVLRCREVDSNLDGAKDVVRFYDENGQPTEEHADSDYDGKLDTWVEFAAGKVARVQVDTDADGRSDETREYRRGSLSRVRRDTNSDGAADVWEIYDDDGRLVRLGVDLDFDGRVDRWSRADDSSEEPDQQAQGQSSPQAASAP